MTHKIHGNSVLRKKIKRERERKVISCSMDWKINIVKLSIILKTIWKLIEIPAKIPMALPESEQKPYNLFGIKKEPKRIKVI